MFYFMQFNRDKSSTFGFFHRLSSAFFIGSRGGKYVFVPVGLSGKHPARVEIIEILTLIVILFGERLLVIVVIGSLTHRPVSQLQLQKCTAL